MKFWNVGNAKKWNYQFFTDGLIIKTGARGDDNIQTFKFSKNTRTMEPAILLAGVILISIGGLLAFFGYSLFRGLLLLSGLTGGGVTGYALGTALGLSKLVSVIIGLGLGAAGAWLAQTMFVIGVFLIGSVGFGAMGSAVQRVTGWEYYGLIILVLAIAGGVLAVLLRKFMIVLVTAVDGAYLLTAGIFSYIDWKMISRILNYTHEPPDPEVLRRPLFLPIWFLITLAGMGVQYGLDEEEPPEKKTQNQTRSGEKGKLDPKAHRETD